MILVTGATGTNGRAIVQKLLSGGHSVRAMVRNASKADDLGAVERVEADYSDPSSLRRALDGVQAALQLTPVDARQLDWATAFVDAARERGVRVVRFSGMGASPEANNELLRLHGRADALLKASGLPFTILQANSFHQNIFFSLGTIQAQGAFYFAIGDARQSFVDVRDIADVAVRALTEPGHEGQVYEVTGPRALSYGDLASILSDVLGRSINYVPVPLDAAVQGMLDAGMPSWDAHALGDLYADFATGNYARTTDTVRRVTGHDPIDFRQFVEDHRAAFAH